MRKILVIEDNRDTRDILQTLLEHFEFEVLVATNGLDGIRMVKDQLPDLVLMDLSLPVVDGWEATRVLKESEQTRHIPIVAITAHVLDGDRERALEAGCDEYIAKPITPAQLVSQLESLLQGFGISRS